MILQKIRNVSSRSSFLKKDDKIKEQMKHSPDVSAEIKTLEDEFDDDTESIITNDVMNTFLLLLMSA